MGTVQAGIVMRAILRLMKIEMHNNWKRDYLGGSTTSYNSCAARINGLTSNDNLV
jgi:ribosomal protein S5